MSASPELRAAIAVARRDLQEYRRYPLTAAGFVLNPLYQFLIPAFLFGATFLVDGRALGLGASAGTTDVAGFLFMGSLVGGLVAVAFWRIAWSFRMEMDAGTLEPAWLTPTRRETFVLGHCLSGLAIFSVSGILLLAIGGMFFGLRVQPTIVLALPAMLVAALGMVGIGYLLTAAVLVMKESNLFVDAMNFVITGLSGVAFPIVVLPGLLLPFALALPTTYALDILRVHALGARPFLDPVLEHVALVALVALAYPLGRWALRRAERWMSVQGTLAHH